MPKLIIFSDSPTEFTIEVGSTSIGRDKSNDISLNDSSISKQHALITYQIMAGGRRNIILTDLHSTNGTYVNGKMATYHNLKDNDQLSIGQVHCAYVDE